MAPLAPFAAPRVRVFILSGCSILLFLFVVARLLPSTDIRVWSREDPINRTANVFLVTSGALASIPPRVRTMPLVPIVVAFRKSITFDQVSREFIGTSALLPMMIINRSAEEYSLRQGTRLTNQAGVTFRIQSPLLVPAGGERTVVAKAESLDMYGEITGERGNVPAGLKWEIPGLSPLERQVVYGENRSVGSGGTSLYRPVLRAEDIAVAKRRLEQELQTEAKQLVEEERAIRNAQQAERWFDILYYPELTRLTFDDFVLPTSFVGEEVSSVPIEGGVTYTVFAYDAEALLAFLAEELRGHVQEGREIVPETVERDRLTIHVIDYADDLSWIKLTVDLSGKERYVLDPFSPLGIQFGKKVRESVAGLSMDDALRIMRNMPELQKVEISLWPPWNTRISTIPSHIVITEQ